MTIISDDPKVQEHYEACVAEGTSPALAEMFALAQAPYGKSDATYMSGHCNGSQFEKSAQQGNHYKKVTEQHGGTVKGKRYLSQLARFPGDPQAWVSGRDDIKRVCEKNGWGCEGSVTTPLVEREPTPKPDVAEDIVNRVTLEVAQTLPDPHRIDLPYLKEQVREKIRPPKHLRRKT